MTNDHQKPEVLSDELNGWREDAASRFLRLICGLPEGSLT